MWINKSSDIIIINYQLLLLIIMRKLHNSLTYDNDNDEYKFVNANLHNVCLCFHIKYQGFVSVLIFSVKIQWKSNWINENRIESMKLNGATFLDIHINNGL